MVMSNYSNAYTEVYTILNCLDEEELSKIPEETLSAIEENRNNEYYYELDEELELREQPMLAETKAILFNLFRDYLSTPEQKEKIIKMQKEERLKNEEKKKVVEEVKGMSRGIRKMLGDRVRYQLRIIPELQFFEDDSLDYIENIDHLLKD